MEQRIVAKSKRTPMLKIGEDMKTAEWYFLKDKVKKYVYDNLTNEDIQQGVYVENMKVEEKMGKRYISYLKITKNKADNTKVEEEMKLPDIDPNEANNEFRSKYRQFSRPKAERKEIVSQAIGHMVSRVLVGCGKEMEIGELENLIEALYYKFAEVVEEYVKKEGE